MPSTRPAHAEQPSSTEELVGLLFLFAGPAIAMLAAVLLSW